MANEAELAQRLYRRFKGVPNFELTDAEELVEDSLNVHGYKPSADVPADKESLILLYAQYNGAWQVALSVAHYFKFTDGEEQVDKSMIADNYRKLAKDLQDDYESEKGKLSGNNFRVMKRIDRPLTMPARSRYQWRR